MPDKGPEYLVQLLQGANQVVDGRTRVDPEVQVLYDGR